MSPTRALVVEDGEIIVLRCYDVAYSIDLEAVERLAADLPTSRIRLDRAEPKAIAFGTPPLALHLGGFSFEADGDTVRGTAMARLYPFGVVALHLRVDASGLDWSDFAERSAAVNDALATDPSGLWPDLLDRTRTLIAPAMSRPSLAGIEEDYTLSVVRRFDRPVIAEALRGEVDLAALLAHESRPLSAGAKRDLLRHAYSWYEDDLVAITWDHAFVYDPNGGDEDIADVLEVANVQLLEMRYYDDVLDAELPRMYERVQQARGRFGGLARTRYANLARALQTLVAEVVELTERVDNALIVTEDTYLARIYGAGVDLFRVQTWAGAVNRKLSLIRETYTTLYDEAATARAEYLEAAIVLLIVFEIVMALL